jgi:hypothetical protein
MRILLLWLAVSNVLAADRRELDIDASQVWTDTGIDLRAGDIITVMANGTVEFDSMHISGPDGLTRTWTDMTVHYPLANLGRGALIGRFTNNPAAIPFLVGTNRQRTTPLAGRLFLGINELAGNTGSGRYHVTVEWAQGVSPVARAAAYLPRVTQQMLDSIPPRVTDEEGNLGDRVNFIVVGSQDRLKAALAATNWVLVDRTRKEAVMHGLMTSLSKQSYVAMPMSDLQLFGRVQDFGYAQADPLKVVESRHHFRIWKAPLTLDGEQVWAGAGTHDVGFDKDHRDNRVTHRIDPATDGERDYIGQGLVYSGLVVKEEYMMPTYPVREGRTATGDSFTSDGRTLLIYLQP